MKEATIVLKLTKDHEVIKTNVTPVEAMLLVAEHHGRAGGNPVTVDKATIKEISIPGEPGKDGKPTTRTRTVDEELDRLRTKYNSAKVSALSGQVKDIPTEDFDKAVERGIKIALPNPRLSETRI